MVENGNTTGLLKPGALFGNYTIEKILGHGGMGAVYLVRHNVLDTLFAIKVLSPAAVQMNGIFVDRFIREGKLACKIRHPNLIAVHDAGRNPEHDLYYIVMDYVPGGSVRDLLNKESRLDPDPALKIIIQVARALCAAYDNHLVHRDIKPDNIMFASDGTVKLADLGLAKSIDDQDPSLTVTAAVFGTPAYMSPEQALDSGKVDIRADIYSLGIVFYEILAGQRPYNGGSSMAVLAQVLAETDVPDIRTIRPRIPAELAELIAAMTAKKLEKRIQTPAELLRRLENIRIPADWNESAVQPAQRSDLAADSPDDPMVTVPTIPPSQFQTTASAGHREKKLAARSGAPAAVAAPDHSKSDIMASAPRSLAKKLCGQKKILLLIGGFLLAVLILSVLFWLTAAWKSGQSDSPSPANGSNRIVPANTVLPEPARRVSGNTAMLPAEKAPAISSDPLTANQIVLLAGTSDFARGIKAGLVQSFGREKVAFQMAENMGDSRELLKAIIKSSPAAVVIAFADKYLDDHISAASFENLIHHHADLLRDNGIRFVFVLVPETENSHQAKAFNLAIRDLCKSRSFPLVLNGSRQNADLTRTIRDLEQQ
ncbi:MAG: serine/threonine protein kinase [Lentisphaeria bacterium]|nr:serine/threonine protein kinase [Lentisphaeria bacterium]